MCDRIGQDWPIMYILNGQILGKCNAPRFKTRFPGSLSGETLSGATVNALASANRTQKYCVKLSGAELKKSVGHTA